MRFVLTGIREGFRIGFHRASPLHSASRNMHSAREHPEVVQDKECSLGRMLGPFLPPGQASLPQCRFGVIPKGRGTGKWRLITDLSYPPGLSVNDGIDPDLCSLVYTSVVARYPPGALLAKIDIESAYRLVPVHPSDRPLQAVEWRGALYVDPMLPFGLRSAPKLFNALADVLEWYLRWKGVRHIFHYLDDFLVVGPPGSPECAIALTTLNKACAGLGIPIAEHKRNGPTTCLTFLGIEVDTIAGQLRLLADKLDRLQSLLLEWGDRKACQRRELESLVGILNRACKVVRSGRTSLRRMLYLLHGVLMHPLRPHPIRLNRAFRSDLAWWKLFASEWNGVSFLRSVELSVMIKELLPIVLACTVWGRFWANTSVRCLCDNQAVVACLRSRTSRDSHCMHMLRTLAFIESRHTFVLRPEYINTKDNHLADDLSRDNLHSFLSKVPGADTRATPLPNPLLDLLLDPSLDWTSPRWLRQFRDTFRRASHHQPDEHMVRQ